MVEGIPYVHFKINNEPPASDIDYSHIWATTVETTKGPINEPVLITSASQANTIFGIDMRPYFAQGAEGLIMVRVVPSNATADSPQKGVFSFTNQEDIVIYRAQQSTTKALYNFTSYSDAQGTTEWGTGIVEVTGKENNQYVEVIVRQNSTDASFVGKKFYIDKNASMFGTKHELFTDAGNTSAGIYVSISQGKQYIHKLYYTIDNNEIVILIQERDSNGILIPESFIDSWNTDGTRKSDASEYSASVVKGYYTPVKYVIPKGTSLFNVTTKYEGDYGITVSVKQSSTSSKGSYDIVLTDPALGSIKMNHVYDIRKIVNRINDSRYNFTASSTDAGLAISEAMTSTSTYIELYEDNNFKASQSDITSDKLIKNHVTENTFITTAIEKNTNIVRFLTADDVALIELDKQNGTDYATVKILDYAINLVQGLNQPLVGSSNGAWDTEENRLPAEYRAEAHEIGLNLLRKVRLGGIFCMYGDNTIQLKYVYHGKNPIEPEKGMNNDETCKWRTILLGANNTDRSSANDLANKALELNDQYILLLGQGLIDTGMNGISSRLNRHQREIVYGVYNEHQLLPYECTQYIAGLRAKLQYDESIFGGQGRKRIRSIGELDIAPLFDYETEYEWDPKTYMFLNQSGVLTFTADYGHISLTDGVTTVQAGSEEDEESVMNILKYAQNGIYDICLPYIGRNINSDLEQSIDMEIQSFLEDMKTGDQSIIDTDEYDAYEFEISLGTRSTQLLGKIFIYLKITPVHALRQVEVEMTVQ